MNYRQLLEENKPLLIFNAIPSLTRIYRSKTTFKITLCFVLLIILGLVGYTCFTTTKTPNKLLLARESMLNEEISKIENRNDILEAEILLLKNDVKSLSRKKDKRKLNKISKYLADTEITGEGVEIVLSDNNSDYAPVQEEYTVVHNTDLLKIVNFLWEQNATAIAINNERIVQNSAISCVGATILVNKKRINSPFIIQAIGKNLEKGMVENASIVLSLKLRGIELEISEKPDITLPAGKYSSYKE